MEDTGSTIADKLAEEAKSLTLQLLMHAYYSRGRAHGPEPVKEREVALAGADESGQKIVDAYAQRMDQLGFDVEGSRDGGLGSVIVRYPAARERDAARASAIALHELGVAASVIGRDPYEGREHDAAKEARRLEAQAPAVRAELDWMRAAPERGRRPHPFLRRMMRRRARATGQEADAMVQEVSGRDVAGTEDVTRDDAAKGARVADEKPPEPVTLGHEDAPAPASESSADLVPDTDQVPLEAYGEVVEPGAAAKPAPDPFVDDYLPDEAKGERGDAALGREARVAGDEALPHEVNQGDACAHGSSERYPDPDQVPLEAYGSYTFESCVAEARAQTDDRSHAQVTQHLPHRVTSIDERM